MTSLSPNVTTSGTFTFPYTLDTFQVESIAHLDRGESVLVSAHTSAGKTTVAIYAIAMHLKAKRRVIYTAPIKALSNQKFRELSDQFDSVGLMTGDTTVKPSADCLVMTTEILRSMLYRGTEMLREVGCVIFDEVHYMRDEERGVVWEETIIMLPEKCQYVFLSATIPNGPQFAAWVMAIHPGLKCHVVHTEKRPVPLRHYVFPQNASGITRIVENNIFHKEAYTQAISVLNTVETGDKAEENALMTHAEARETHRSHTKSGFRALCQQILQVMTHIIQNDLHPCIIFVFSRAECESLALSLAKKKFNTGQEERLVEKTYKHALEGLSDEDRKLPAVQQFLPLLQHGVGIHHSGLLPVLKEVVELLFQAGLVKCLFSTETFSMGLNMPARTVVFSGLRKFDGINRRILTSGEYIQMSGRAGRRGLDQSGVVIILMETPMESSQLKELVSGKADQLNSTFHLTYNMVLNLLRGEDVDPTFMMMRSFYQFQHEGQRPALETKLSEAQEKIEQLAFEQPIVCEQYWAGTRVLRKMQRQMQERLSTPARLLPFLQPGRVVHVVCRAGDRVVDFGFGIILHCNLRTPNLERDQASSYRVEILSYVQEDESKVVPVRGSGLSHGESSSTRLGSRSFELHDIDEVTKLRIKLSEDKMSSLTLRPKQERALAKTLARYRNKPPLLDLFHDMKMSDEQMILLSERITVLQEELHKNPLSAHEEDIPLALSEAYRTFEHKKALEKEIQTLQEELSKQDHVVLTVELQKMMSVLRRLDYLDENNLLLRKGRIACEITTADQDELLLTELLFQGVFNDMETEMVVAMLSCLVNTHKTPENFDPDEKFHDILRQLYDTNARIFSVYQDAGFVPENQMSEEDGRGGRIKPSLVEIAYKWAKGHKFAEIIRDTDAYEGDIVRMLRRLEEVLRQVGSAARSPAMGSDHLYEKMMLGIQKIKRDIVFASSLYL